MRSQKHVDLVFLFLLSSFIFSCGKKDSAKPDENSGTVKVRLGITGELTSVTSPLGKVASVAAADQIIYGVIISRREGSKDTTVAYGLFDDPTKMSVDLHPSTTYKIHVTAFKKGSGLGLFVSGTTYGAPFNLTLNNKFIYQKDEPFWNVYFSELPSILQRNGVPIITEYGEIDRYLGNLENFVPQNNDYSANIFLLRLSSGVKFKAPGLTEGEIIISGYITDTIRSTTKETADRIYSLYSKAYLTGKFDSSYSKSPLEINAVWKKADGSTKVLLNRTTITTERNKLTTFTLVTPLSTAISLTMETSVMQGVNRSINATGFYIGQSYAGGTIFYLDGTGEHGLIAAPTDLAKTYWDNAPRLIGSTLSNIGTGQANTSAIVNKIGAGQSAASLCNSYTNGGFDDWYLPSILELKELYLNREYIPSLKNEVYWSSTETQLWMVSMVWFTNGNIVVGDKPATNGSVRPIRSF